MTGTPAADVKAAILAAAPFLAISEAVDFRNHVRISFDFGNAHVFTSAVPNKWTADRAATTALAQAKAWCLAAQIPETYAPRVRSAQKVKDKFDAAGAASAASAAITAWAGTREKKDWLAAT